jgi:predicted nucleic-acid-binding Zn-ribbon protein
MKRSLKCIKCGCSRLWIVDKISDATFGPDTELSIGSTMSIWDKEPRVVFNVQAMICANEDCGYTEFYTYKFDRLIDLHKKGANVRLMDSAPGDQGPYR